MQTTDRELAIRSFINVWLKDPQPYCHGCGQRFLTPNRQCCEFPRIATNAQIVSETIQDVRALKQSRANEFASTKKKTLRWVLRLPHALIRDIEMYFDECGKKQLSEQEYLQAANKDEFRLFNKHYTAQWFAKKFPQFAVAEKI